jgi:hypothetical protein
MFFFVTITIADRRPFIEAAMPPVGRSSERSSPQAADSGPAMGSGYESPGRGLRLGPVASGQF